MIPPLISSEILLVSKTKEERRDWMVKLQQQNPNLLSPDIHVDPDTPLPSRKHVQTSPETPEEVPTHLLLVPSSTSMSRNVSFDETLLNVLDEHSDYEDSFEMTNLDKGTRSNDLCETNLDEGIRFDTSYDIQADVPGHKPIAT